jgi:hypothetical protein
MAPHARCGQQHAAGGGELAASDSRELWLVDPCAQSWLRPLQLPIWWGMRGRGLGERFCDNVTGCAYACRRSWRSRRGRGGGRCIARQPYEWDEHMFWNGLLRNRGVLAKVRGRIGYHLKLHTRGRADIASDGVRNNGGWIIYHDVFTQGGFAFDPRYSSSAVPLADYLNYIGDLNPGVVVTPR